MRNFNTNQARHLYVALGKKDTIAGVTSNGDICLASNEAGDMYFVYKNADGIITRSDTIPAGCVEYFNKKTAAQLAKPLVAHTLAVDTTAVTLANLIGKTVRLTIFVRQFVGFDENDAIPIVVELTGDGTNTANATAFHKALAYAIAQAMPKRDIPYFKIFSNGTEVTPSTAAGSITGNAGGVVLVATPQKWVRGKMSNEPFILTVQFNYTANGEDIVWGSDTVAASAIDDNTTLSADYEIADLEYFSYGERGDIFRGSTWPNDYTPTYIVTPGTGYHMLTIQYFWQGKAENVQKSPRTIQIAGSQAIINALYSAVDAVVNGGGSGSGTGA